MRARLSVPALFVAAAIAAWVPLAAQEPRPVEKVSLRTDQALDIFLDVIRESKLKKDWPRALRALREIERFIETNGDEYILPAPGPAGQSTGILHTSAREAAFREFATFPKEALASWRLSADRAVCDALGACRLRPDISLLEKVIAKFPISSFSPDALDLLGAIYLERADFPSALRVCSRAYSYFPGLAPEMKARFDLLRIISLTGLTGTRPGHLIARFKADFAHVNLPLYGSLAPARNVLAACLASVRPPSSDLTALPGGVGALLCSSQLPDTRQAERLLHAAEMSRLRVGLHTAPVVAGNRILFCDGSRLAALRAADMAQLWSFTAQNPPLFSAIHNAYCRPAISGELVAASLGSKLHVFDLATGLHKWSAAPGHAEDTTHVFLSSPCISGNTVLIGAAAWGKEVTCSLFAYDLEKGSLRWKRRVVTGFPTDTFRLGSQPGPPVAWGGAVYFVTNLGAAVCCDIENGAIQWLRKYPAADSYLKEETLKAGRRWALAPPVLCHGVFIAAPQDSSFMFAADAMDGTLLWQEPRVGLEELRFLGGTSGNLVFAAGSIVRAFHCRSGKVAWTSSLPAPAEGPVAVFSERLVVPCGRALAQLAPVTGKKLGNYALPGEPGLPQHVAGFERNFLLATPLQVRRFQCYDDSMRAARASLTVDSTDPAALLTCGSLLWRNGEHDRGIRMLRDCLKNLSDKDPIRAQATTELLLAARTAAESAAGEARGEHLETAARFSSMREQPQFLLEAASAYESAGLTVKALQVYREVLVNHQARNVVLVGRAVYADDYARVCEREILQSNPALRKKQEKLADKLLAEKGPGASPQHLIAVIRAFPNSDAAAKAYIRLGEYCLREKLLVSAELYLSEFLFRTPQSRHADQARVLLCETYLGKNDALRAKELLSQLSGRLTTIKVGNATKKAGEYARSKLALPEVAKASLEDSLLLPLSRLWQTTPCLAQSAPDIIGADAEGKILYTLGPNLLDCRSTKTGELLARFDLSNTPVPSTARRAGVVVEGGVVVLSGKRLLMVGADKEKQVWKWGTTLGAPETAPGIGPGEQPLLGKFSAGVLVLWPRSRLIAFNAKTGARAWQYKSRKPFLELPVEAGGILLLVQADGAAAVALDPKTGKEKFRVELEGDTLAASSVTKCGDRVLVLRGSRDTYCLDSKGGILWTMKGDSFVSSAVYLAPDRVTLIPGPGAKRELKCLDLADGSLKWKSEISQDDVVAQLAGERGLYLAQRPRFGMTSILAFDTATGKRRWLWRQPQGGYVLIRQTPAHLIACVVDRLLTRIHIINKARGVQDQTISLFAEMYQSGLVKNGRLYLTTDRCAYCFSPVKHALARQEYVKVLRQLLRKATPTGELEKLAARYAEFQAFDDAADALGEMVKANWKLSESEIRRLVERAGGYRYSPDHAGSPVIEVPKMEGRVKTDGILDDGWTPSLAIERGLESVFKVDLPRTAGGEWLAKNDLSATFYFGWDKENFYFALDARDSIMRPWDRDEKEIWKGDFLLIALDPLGDGGWMPRADDVLLSMGLTLPRRNLTQEEREEEERNKPKGEYFVKRREDDSGAVYEARIPWALFNENGTNIDPQNGPPEGFTFGLDLILLDDDTGGCTTKTLNLARGLLLGRRNALWRAFVPRKFATIRLKGK